MKVVDLPIEQLREAPWNPNRMEPAMLEQLKVSIRKFGMVENLVVRPIARDTYEVLSGNQRLKVLRELGLTVAPCVMLHLDDAHVRLLAQAFNRLVGEDDLGLKAELMKQVLAALPQEEVLALLPETAESLQALTSLGQEDMASYLASWQQAQAARLKHLQFQLTPSQLEVVEEALSRVLPKAKEAQGESPSVRGAALYLLCRAYLEARRV